MTQEIIVCKYGGSSITCRADIEHIGRITRDDPRRKIIVVSAPGRRAGHDKKDKVTEGLIDLLNTNDSKYFDYVIGRFAELSPGRDMLDKRQELERKLGRVTSKEDYRDSVIGYGEIACAQLVAESLGFDYIAPEEFYILSDEPGKSRILQESYSLARRRFANLRRPVVLPGFIGKTRDGKYVTLDRGGSDLTGGFVAAAVLAVEYENFTDSPILSADPGIVDNPKKINELVYKESRDLSFSGFNILHHQAMLPCEEANVPLQVRSTRTYPEQGTLIKRERELDSSRPIVGVAYKPGFYYTFVEKPGLDDMLGVLHRLTGIFEREGIQLLDIPGAIDEISFIYHNSCVKNQEQLRKIEERIYDVIGKRGTSLETRNNLGMVAVAGMGIAKQKGILEDVADCITAAGVDILTVCQGVKKRCALYGVNESQGKQAVNAIYDRFLR